VNRKVCGGNRTWTGAATQSRIMSLLHTAHQNGVDAIGYLAALARAPNAAAIPPAPALTPVRPAQPYTQINPSAPR
jgi:hypothetical protein